MSGVTHDTVGATWQDNVRCQCHNQISYSWFQFNHYICIFGSI